MAPKLEGRLNPTGQHRRRRRPYVEEAVSQRNVRVFERLEVRVDELQKKGHGVQSASALPPSLPLEPCRHIRSLELEVRIVTDRTEVFRTARVPLTGAVEVLTDPTARHADGRLTLDQDAKAERANRPEPVLHCVLREPVFRDDEGGKKMTAAAANGCVCCVAVVLY